MVEPPRKRVLISYARKDAARLATELQRDLQSEHDVWLDTNRIAGGCSWTVEVEKAIDNCEVLLALLSPGSYVSDVCRAEQLRALRCGKRVIPCSQRPARAAPCTSKQSTIATSLHSRLRLTNYGSSVTIFLRGATRPCFPRGSAKPM